MPDPVPFNYIPPYNPAGSMGFGQGGMGAIMAPLLTQYLQGFAGPTNFLPHQNPAQAITDQLAMRQYFSSTQANVHNSARMGTGHFANVIAGGMSTMTQGPLTDLNRQQAHSIAGMVNNPYVKPFLAAAVGPENLEAMMFGSKGDPSMMAGVANKIGFYRPDPATGARRMGAQSLQDFSSGLYASLYEPSGNIEEMVTQSRSADAKVREPAMQKLKTAAGAEHETVVADDDLTKRIADLGTEAVRQIYKKYQPGGSATTVAEQARELTKFDRAVQETGVLGTNETHVGNLQRRAEKAAAESMHGFMAGQTAQVTEHLFQRGMLPQSIGALSAADRVKVLSEQNLDSETTSRLAREFGHRDMMQNNEKYREAVNSGNAAEQATIMNRELPTYERRITKSMDKIKERQKTGGPIEADEAEKMLKMDGMDSVASNVDAGRASGVIKKHTEALAAVRQIFGDNGNPNAPIPALMAALDHLSQGSASRMGNSGKVASTLREMRTMAKEMGMGFEQMAGMAATVGAYGDQLGLASETKLGATQNAMGMVQAMDRAGTFSGGKFGSLTREDAMRHAAEISARGEASVGAKGAAAIRRLYKESPERFKDTDLGTIAQKMEDPNWDGTYTDRNGQQKNFFQDVGRGGMNTLAEIAGNANVSMGDLTSRMADDMTQEDRFGNSVLLGMRAEATEQLANQVTSGVISRGAQGGGLENREDLQLALSRRLTEMVIDSSDKDRPEQLQYLEKTAKAEFEKVLVAEGYPADQARVEAERVFQSLGTTQEERITRLGTLASETNVGVKELSGGRFTGTRQLREITVGTEGAQDAVAKAAVQAQQDERAGLFYQGTPMMRGSDYLAEIGRTGEAFNFDKFLQTTFGITSNSEMRKRLAPELAGAFASAQQQIEDATVTDKYINDAIAQGDESTLTELATRGMTDPKEKEAFKKKFKTKVTDEQLAQKRKEKLDKTSDEEVSKIYDRVVGKKGTAKTASEKRAEILARHSIGTDVAELEAEKVLGEGEYTTDMQREAARQSLGQARGKTEAERQKNEELRQSGLTQLVGLYGGDIRKVKEGAYESLKQAAKTGGFSLSADKISELVNLGLYTRGDEKGKEKFDAAVKSLNLRPEQAEQVQKALAASRGAIEADLAAYLSPEQAAAEAMGQPGAPKTTKPGTPTPGAKQAPGEAAKDVAKEGGPADAPGAPTPATGEQAQPDAQQTGNVDGLSKEIDKLSTAITGMTEPFNKLIAAIAANRPATDKDVKPTTADKSPGATTAQDAAQGGTTPVDAPGNPAPPTAPPRRPFVDDEEDATTTPAPGGEEAGKQLAAGETGDAAQDAAKDNEQKEGPLNKDKQAQQEKAEEAAKGPGAATAKNVDQPPKEEPPKQDPNTKAVGTPGSPATATGDTPPQTDAKPSPGGAEAGKELAAADAEKPKPGPLTADSEAKKAQEEQDAKGPGATTAQDAGKPAAETKPDPNTKAVGTPGKPATATGDAPPQTDAKPSPGGAEAGKELAATEAGKTKPGPLTADKEAKKAKEEQDAKGPGATTAQDVAEPAAEPKTDPNTKAVGTPGSPAAATGDTPPVTQRAPRRPFVDDTEESAPKTERQSEPKTEVGLDTLSAEIGKLTSALSGIDKPFNDLVSAIAAIKPDGGKGSAAKSTEPERQPGPVRERRVPAPQVAANGNSGGGSIRGTLTLVGLQSAVLAARGAQVYTPTGDGPSIVGDGMTASSVSPG